MCLCRRLGERSLLPGVDRVLFTSNDGGRSPLRPSRRSLPALTAGHWQSMTWTSYWIGWEAPETVTEYVLPGVVIQPIGLNRSA